MKIDQSFSQRTIAIYGTAGAAWIEELPQRIQACQKKWNLTQMIPVENLSYNFVVYAQSHAQQVVLKLGIPHEPECLTEIKALQVFNGQACVKLLDIYPEQQALLLERLSPGVQLNDFDCDDQAMTAIAAQVMQILPKKTYPSNEFPTVLKWTAVFERMAKKDGLPQDLLQAAQALSQTLWQSTSTFYLLHGDLHHENILLDEERGWLAIDPKGVIGDRAFEAARFLHNPYPSFLEDPNPKKLIQERAEVIANFLDTTTQRVLEWGFIDSLLSASWSVEEGLDTTYALECAQLQYQLLGAVNG